MNCTNPGGCTLTANDLVERVAAWRNLSSRALSRDVQHDRIVSVYPSEQGVLRTLRGLIAAEAECCAFLKFIVKEGPDETVVELSFPPEARPLIESVIPARTDG